MWEPGQLERIRCDFCGGDDSNSLGLRRDGMMVVECRQCGLSYLNPRPRPEVIGRLYEQAYFGNAESSNGIGYAVYADSGCQKRLLRLAESRLDLLGKYWQPESRRCLEIGCATGEFCSLLKARGARPVGLDLSDFAIAEARRRYPGLDFRVSDADQIAEPEGFDAILAFELVEHVLSPSRFLRLAYSLLTPGGLLVLSTPNLQCGKAVGCQHWLGFNISFEHLYFFTPDVLLRFAKSIGFEPLVWLSGWGDGIYQAAPTTVTESGARAALRKLGLLAALRRMKRSIVRQPREPEFIAPKYVVGGNGHNLILCLVKPPTAPG